MVTIEWTTEQALSGTLTGPGVSQTYSGANLVDGSFSFEIGSEAQTFEFTVVNGSNTDTQSVTIDIDPPEFSITSFAATPNPVEPSALLTLNWETDNAVSARILGGQNDYDVPTASVARGEWQTTITQTTTFTLEIQSEIGEMRSAETTVVVEGGEPSIDAFSASETAIVEGDSITLTWDTIAAESIAIVDDTGATVSTAGQAPTGGSVTVSPTADRTYTLTASNGFGDVTAMASVTVEAVLNIDSFTGSAAQITEGDMLQLGWTVSGTAPTLTLADDQGGMVDISGQPVASGSINVSPTTSRTYTLTATTPLQSDTAQVSVTVVPPVPVINSFTASPTEVVTGGSTTLAWNIAGADTITIVNDLGTTIPTAGRNTSMDSVAVNLNATRTFTLTATNTGGTDTATVTVVAGDAVAITNLTATPSSVSPGQSVTISWTTANATSVDLESNLGDMVDLTGKNVATDSVTITPSATATYTLTAQGLGGPATRDVIITVQPAVSVGTFTVSPTTVLAGSPVTLAWTTSNATSIQITYVDGGGTSRLVNTVGKLVSGDSVTITPTESVTYTLAADGFQGPATATASVTVQQPVAVSSFTTNRTAIASGETATLTWATANATGVTITDSSGATVDTTGKAAAGDSVDVTPTADETYTISAAGPGGPATLQVAVEVVDPDGLTISEVLADPTGTNDQRQWVELTNTGTTILDLSQFALGSGSAAYNETLLQLAGTLAPGDCVVVGGPTSDASNGSPTYDVSGDFNPDLPASGGVGVFVGPIAEQAGSRTPVTSIVYGGSNPNGLIDSTGAAQTELSPALVEGQSLTRTSDSDSLTLDTPTPGQCFHVQAMTPSVGSSGATGTVSVTGWGFDTALDTFAVGTDALTGCTTTATGVDCTLPTSTQSGAADLVVSRVNEYVSDGAGGTMLMALGTSIDATLADAYFYELEIADPGVSFYCGITGASPISPVTLATDVTVTVEIYLAGETDVNGALPAGYEVEALEFAGGVGPATIFDASWVAATAGPVSGNNVTYSAVFNNAAATTSEIAFRVGLPGGSQWYYCDTNASSGSDDGYQVNGGQSVTWQ